MRISAKSQTNHRWWLALLAPVFIGGFFYLFSLPAQADGKKGVPTTQAPVPKQEPAKPVKKTPSPSVAKTPLPSRSVQCRDVVIDNSPSPEPGLYLPSVSLDNCCCFASDVSSLVIPATSSPRSRFIYSECN